MSNDSLRHEFGEILALVQDQMQDLATMQRTRAELVATASAAAGTVEVTVDAQHVVTKTVVDEAYLEDFELSDLGGHVTAAAQAAARQVDERSSALLAPMSERRKALSEVSQNVFDAPDIKEMLGHITSLGNPPPAAQSADEGAEADTSFPVIRR